MLMPDRRLLLAALSAGLLAPAARAADAVNGQAPCVSGRPGISVSTGWPRSPKKTPASLTSRRKAGPHRSSRASTSTRSRRSGSAPTTPCGHRPARSGFVFSSQQIFRRPGDHLHAVDGGKSARDPLWPGLFRLRRSGWMRAPWPTLGFAGFRVMDAAHNSQTDWLAFQGASYFRSVRPGRAIWRLGPRHRHQHRGRDAGGISPLQRILAGGPMAQRSPSMPCWMGPPSPAPTASTAREE